MRGVSSTMSVNIPIRRLERLKSLQKDLASKIIVRPLNIENGFIAGVDVSYNKDLGFCSVVVLRYPELEVINVYNAKRTVRFPYIPGFLSFREMPVVLKAFERVREDIFLIFCDGQGIAHPRGFGLASHIGVELNLPSIGCAKSRLVGEYSEPDSSRGSYSPLYYKDKVVGVVLRTRDGVSPVFVSIGNKIDIDSAVRYTLNCSRTRIPEPLRLAHHFVTEYRKRD